jgi:hypothetical protein
MDLIVALAMAMTLLIMITMSVGRLQRAERQFADARAAMRTLEATLLQMQAGQAADALAPLTVEALADPAPAGKHWVRLCLTTGPTATGGTRLNLVGLVPVSTGGTP